MLLHSWRIAINSVCSFWISQGRSELPRSCMGPTTSLSFVLKKCLAVKCVCIRPLKFWRRFQDFPFGCSDFSSFPVGLCFWWTAMQPLFRFSPANFSLHRCVQNGSGAHPASYPVGTRGSFPEGKAAGGVKLTTHFHLVQRSKNEWSYTSTPPTRLHGVVLS
jgi:hypothetical protein